MEIQSPRELSEVEDAINMLPSKKTPSPDGVNVEFYKRFESISSPFLLHLFGHAYQVESLPYSFTKAHTVLIPTPDDVEKITTCNRLPPHNSL